MKENNKVVGQKKFDLQDRFIAYMIIIWLLSPAICRKKDKMLDIFSTPSNSPYARGELISFCCRKFPSLLIGGRVMDGGHNNSNNEGEKSETTKRTKGKKYFRRREYPMSNKEYPSLKV